MNTAVTWAKLANSTTFFAHLYHAWPENEYGKWYISLSLSLFPIDLNRRADFFHSKKMWMRVVWEIGIVSLLFLSLPPPGFWFVSSLSFLFLSNEMCLPISWGWMGTLPAIASCRMTFVQNFEFSQKERQTDRGGGTKGEEEEEEPFFVLFEYGKKPWTTHSSRLWNKWLRHDTISFLPPLFICEIGSFSSSFSLVNPRERRRMIAWRFFIFAFYYRGAGS